MQIHIKVRHESRKKDMNESYQNCERCWNNKWSDIHHIISRRLKDTDTPENLIMLCRKCHDYAHSNNTQEMKEELFKLVEESLKRSSLYRF